MAIMVGGEPKLFAPKEIYVLNIRVVLRQQNINQFLTDPIAFIHLGGGCMTLQRRFKTLLQSSQLHGDHKNAPSEVFFLTLYEK